MIVRIHGKLDLLEQGSALITPEGGLSYQVHISSYTQAKLAGMLGEQTTLYTFEFFESQGQGSTILPRIAGFLTSKDKEFYELFITCKGIGYRKALRALTLNTSIIAAAIADRDLATLQSLPEIGKKTAETIALNLRDKVDNFITQDTLNSTRSDQVANNQNNDNTPAEFAPGGRIVNEALNALLQLGENRAQAITWIDKAMADDNPPTTAQELLARVYQIRDS